MCSLNGSIGKLAFFSGSASNSGRSPLVLTRAPWGMRSSLADHDYNSDKRNERRRSGGVEVAGRSPETIGITGGGPLEIWCASRDGNGKALNISLFPCHPVSELSGSLVHHWPAAAPPPPPPLLRRRPASAASLPLLRHRSAAPPPLSVFSIAATTKPPLLLRRRVNKYERRLHLLSGTF